MCERCVTHARELYAFLRLAPQRDPMGPSPRTQKRRRARQRAKLASEIFDLNGIIAELDDSRADSRHSAHPGALSVAP